MAYGVQNSSKLAHVIREQHDNIIFTTVVLPNEFNELDKTSYITSLTSDVTHVITRQAVMSMHSPMIYEMMLAKASFTSENNDNPESISNVFRGRILFLL